jgi:hypothetical protein
MGALVPFAIPTKGLNARASLALMEPTYGVSLVNVLAEQYGLRTRKGYTEWAANLDGNTGAVQSIMVYYPAGASPATASQASVSHIGTEARMFISRAVTPLGFGGKVFAARGLGVYDVTAGGLGPFSPIAGVNSPGPFWTSRMFQNTAGAFLVACNDEGGYRIYDGAAWTTPAMGTAPGEIDGVDPSTFCFVMEWKKRLWFVEKDSTVAWYLPVGQITGLAKAFDFGESLPRGGSLVALANWTIDGGAGIDDYLVAVGSQGGIVIYQGTDPDSAADFSQKGVWNVGPLPVGRRQVTAHGGDVQVLSQLGVTPLSKLLRGGTVEDEGVNISYLVDPLIARLMQDYSGLQGWQLVDVPKEELGLVGVPYAAAQLGGDYFALKRTTNAWSILRSTTYTSFANVDAVVYAGTNDGRVVLAFNGPLDNVKFSENTGASIQCGVTPAYQSLGSRGTSKRVMLMRPTFLATLTPSLNFVVLFNYGNLADVTVPTLPSLSQSLWDEALWDQGLWSGLTEPVGYWLGATGAGFAATPQLLYACGGDTLLTSIDLWCEEGGPL